MENPNRPNQTVFKFKDSHRYWWTITAWKSGERVADVGNDTPDFEWAYTIERENIEVYHSSIIGQGDEPIKLRNILYDYLCYVALAMMDGARAVADSSMEIIQHPL